jgi:hypothetical protein
MVDRLQSLVEHHVAEEEQTYFPQAQAALGKDEAETLDEQYRLRNPENTPAQRE